MRWSISVLGLLAGLAAGAASPVDFGRKEFDSAIEARGLKPERFRIVTEQSMALPADGFSIQGNLIRGGNLRGIMYGLLEASAQVRASGRLRQVQASPALAVRGVRWLAPLPEDPAPLFQSLARARFNRFVAVAEGASAEALKRAADAAASHGLDFGVAAGPVSSPQSVIAAIPSLKFIEVEPAEANLAEITRAGRLITLGLDAAALREEGFQAARASRLPLQVIVRPGMYDDYLRKPEVSERSRPWEVIWRLKLPCAAGPKTVRAAVLWMARGQSQGFELEVRSIPAPVFLEIWGRLAYDPEEPDSVLLALMNVPAQKGGEALAALDAAAVMDEEHAQRPLEELLDRPREDPWHASPNEAARLRLLGESSAKSRPMERVAQLREAARRLENSSGILKELKPLGLQARLLAHRLAAADQLAWAKAAGDRDALAAALREAEAALALSPETGVLKDDLAQLNSLRVEPPAARIPARSPGAVARPALDHKPAQRAVAGQPLQLAVRIWPLANVSAVRLHWRPMNSKAAWQILEAPPSRPVFTIPASSVVLSHDIEYFFEILDNAGSGWFLPAPQPLAGMGAFAVETAAPVVPQSGAW